MTNDGGWPPWLYRNRNGAAFEQEVAGWPLSSGGYSQGIAWIDVDDDGDLDLYVANGTMGTDDVPDFGLENFLYLNRGDHTFRRVEAGPATTDARVSAGVAWSDYDRDGDLDLLVATGAVGPVRGTTTSTGTRPPIARIATD